ncbi:hypothetical protein COO60DRAFT_1486521, partial [Scenedesmus sp. NREL 46B-D3]
MALVSHLQKRSCSTLSNNTVNTWLQTIRQCCRSCRLAAYMRATNTLYNAAIVHTTPCKELIESSALQLSTKTGAARKQQQLTTAQLHDSVCGVCQAINCCSTSAAGSTATTRQVCLHLPCNFEHKQPQASCGCTKARVQLTALRITAIRQKLQQHLDRAVKVLVWAHASAVHTTAVARAAKHMNLHNAMTTFAIRTPTCQTAALAQQHAQGGFCMQNADCCPTIHCYTAVHT